MVAASPFPPILAYNSSKSALNMVTVVYANALRDTPVVFLQGPRQAGKSTLAQALMDEGYAARKPL